MCSSGDDRLSFSMPRGYRLVEARGTTAAVMARTVGRASRSEMTLEEDKQVFSEAIQRAIAEVASRRAKDNLRRVVQALRFN